MILITGYKGFIGSHLTKKLDSLGISWIGYDLLDGNDLRDKCKLDSFFDRHQITTVIHLGALAGVRRGEEYPQEYFDTNVMGSENLLKLSKEYGVNKVIFFSSSSIYGDNGHPSSIYGITKLTMEMLMGRYDIPHKYIVRPFTVYGENGRKEHVLFKWFGQQKQGKPITFYGDGSTYRTYTYVGDLVEALVLMLDYKEKEVIFELGGNKKVTLKDFLKVFLELFPDTKVNYLPLPSWDSVGREPNLAEAHKLGWKGETDYLLKIRELLR